MLKGKAVSQRQRAKTQDRESLTAAWQEIPWTKVHRHVFRLQKRMYQATQRGDVRTVRKLQNLLSKSWYARLLAVRRVTQDNRGRHTAGIDGVKSLQPPQRLRLANELTLDDTATPLRRIWIPKRGMPEKRWQRLGSIRCWKRPDAVREPGEPKSEIKAAAKGAVSVG